MHGAAFPNPSISLFGDVRFRPRFNTVACEISLRFSVVPVPR